MKVTSDDGFEVHGQCTKPNCGKPIAQSKAHMDIVVRELREGIRKDFACMACRGKASAGIWSAPQTGATAK
jgi:hypothetical protein